MEHFGHHGPMTPNALYGRDEDRARVRGAQGPVVLVSGDSGIGKSELLASLNDWGQRSLIATPIALGSIQGSLQTAMATALGDCLEIFHVEHPAQALEVWRSLKEIVIRASGVTGRQLGEFLVARLFEYVESKIGVEATQAVRAVIGEVLKSSTSTYEARLENLMQPQVADGLSALAHEIAAHTKRLLVIRLDAGERLTTYDQGLLAELGTSLRGSVKLVVGVNSRQKEGAEIVRLLETRDVMNVQLEALSSSDIRQWLEAANVPNTVWDDIVRVSSGYPLFVKEAIRLVRSGVPLTSLRTPIRFQALFNEAWKRLDPDLKLIGMQLACFVDPPEDSFLESYLGRNALELSVLKRQLVDEGVFVRRVDGYEWFHERRRSHLWEMELKDSDRSKIAQIALGKIDEWLAGRSGFGPWLPLALPGIARDIKSGQLDPQAAKLLQISREQLAILWALIEVVEPDGEGGGFAYTGEVARYAALRAGLDFDPLAALEALSEAELIYMESNDRLSIVCLVAPSPTHQAMILGKIMETFRRQPQPRFASRAALLVLQSATADFKAAASSLGSGTLASHRRALDDLVKKDGGPAGAIPPGIGMELVVDDYPISVTATFESSQQRDSALAELRDQVRQPSMEIRSLIALPPQRVRYGRYLAVLDALKREYSPTAVSSEAELLSFLERSNGLVSSLRACMTDEDAEALGFESHPCVLVETAVAPQEWVEYHILGGYRAGTSKIELDYEVPRSIDPFIELRLRRDGHLEANERLGVTRYVANHGGFSRDPLKEVGELLIKRGKQFNRSLDRVLIEPDERLLTDVLRAERAFQAKAVLRVHRMLGLEPEKAGDTSLYVVIVREPDRAENLLSLDQWSVAAYEVEDGKNFVSVRVLPDGIDLPSFDAQPEELHEIGIEEVDRIIRTQRGEASQVLAELAGYAFEDVWFLDPDLPYADQLRSRSRMIAPPAF